MHSLRQFWDAVGVFFDKLGAVDVRPMLFALLFHMANLMLRSQAWRTILRAAFPRKRIPYSTVFGGYMAGVGVNGVVPARGGDVVKLLFVHTRVEGSNYPTLGATLAVETLFDVPMSLLLMTWAYFAGHLPSLPSIPGLSGFEWSFLAAHSTAAVVVLGVLGFAGAAILILRGDRIVEFWRRLADGFAVLREPQRYLRQVVAFQALGWICRLITAWLFLSAFHVPANLENALLVMVVAGAATALPLTPGGIGPKQALTVVLLAGVAAQSDLLAFSIGMEAGLLLVNLAVGMTCMGALLRGFNIRNAIATAREHQADAAQARDEAGSR